MAKVFKLFACCIPVKGAKRSIVCNLQRNNSEFIPNALYEILKKYDGKQLASIKYLYEQKHDEIIDEFFNFLLEKEFGFWCPQDEVEQFLPIKINWERPEFITNAIIDIKAENLKNFDFSLIALQLDKLACKALQIRAFQTIPIEIINNVLTHFDSSRLRHIDLLLKYDKQTPIEVFQHLCREFLRIQYITFYSSPSILFEKVSSSNAYLNLVSTEIHSFVHCGNINQSWFSVNVELFTESQKHNTCLNRKISIDTEGNIKNCPSMKESYGNIKDTTLREALSKPGFKKYWNINKDQIEVCKDCEFRYICTDCRAYLEDPENSYSKPLKCGYSPYTCEWEECGVPTPSNKKAIEYYSMENLVKSEV